MKINPLGSQGINPYMRQMNKQDQANTMARKAADKVEISSAAKEMQQESQITNERNEKVNELKIQVENGTYKFDPKAVAKSIVNFYKK
jgi:negative regulator of flagellin synthesis FlgM